MKSRDSFEVTELIGIFVGDIVKVVTAMKNTFNAIIATVTYFLITSEALKWQ